MLVEPSGCVPLAVVLFDDGFRAMVGQEVKDRGDDAWNVAIVLSGGNTTMAVMEEVIKEVTLTKL